MNSLVCPKCEGESLHQYKVVSEFRYSEDGSAQRTTSQGGCYMGSLKEDSPDTTISSKVDLSDNPKNRRDNVYISFCCEHCGIIEEPLCIFQHKGTTRIGWEKST